VTAAPFTATRARQEPAETEVLAQPRQARISTPGILRTAVVVLTVGVIVFGLVVNRTAAARRRAAHEVATAASARLTDAADAYVELADADAAESTAFLQGPVESPLLRQRYDRDLRAAAQHLTALAGGGAADARAATQTVTQQLPVYAGLVDSARANNLLGNAVGAAYLHQASSSVMRRTILPQTTSIYEDAARDFDANDHAGMAASEILAVLVVGALLLALLIGTQIYLAVRTRRILNVGLVIATVLVLAVGVWSLVAFGAERDALRRSQRDGSDPLQLLSTARILTLRQIGDDNLELIERGAVDTYRPEFEVAAEQLGGSRGLIAQAGTATRGTGAAQAMRQLTSTYAQFLGDHNSAKNANDRDNYLGAVAVTTGNQARDFQALDAAYQRVLADARTELNRQSRQAEDALTGLAVGAAFFIVLATTAVVLGLRRRIEEYA
jgi:hypothetical protein